MEETNSDTNGVSDGKFRRAGAKARELRESAITAVTDTPGWVWVVVAGVLLLMMGVMAASRYRARSHHDEA